MSSPRLGLMELTENQAAVLAIALSAVAVVIMLALAWRALG